MSLTVIFLINIVIISYIQHVQRADAALYRKGSTGSVVSQIQKKLNDWGYYFGSVDGVYGSKTESGVRYFQSKNGLTPDGLAGDKTLAAIGINTSDTASSYSNNVNLLARLISAESRGEPYSGQVAVGAVVINRTKHPSFPHFDLRRDLPARRVYLPVRRPVLRQRLGQRLQGGAGCAERLGPPPAARDLLFQSGHRHQRLDLVPPAHRHHRQPPLLLVAYEVIIPPQLEACGTKCRGGSSRKRFVISSHSSGFIAVHSL